MRKLGHDTAKLNSVRERLPDMAVACAVLAVVSVKLAAADASPAAASASAVSPPVVKVVEDSAAPTDKTIAGANFSLSYPNTWSVDVKAKDYDPNTNFTLFSPKNSYIQITLLPKTDSAAKIVADTVKKLDGPAITTLSKTALDEWGKDNKGQGFHLKGKIVGTFPGGIKVFVFTSQHFNVRVIEYYFSDELKDVQADIQSISDNFRMLR